MPWTKRLRVYSSIKSPWPTAAAACLSATFLGRLSKPSRRKPAAMDPEVTRTSL